MVFTSEVGDTVREGKRRLDYVKKQHAQNMQDIQLLQEYGELIEKALIVLTEVLSVTQSGVVKFIKDTTASALKYVYGEAYDFHMEFELKRNQHEVVLAPMYNGNVLAPKHACAGGILDVCAFTLRIALWALGEPRTAGVLLFDEPFRNVHGKEENERLAMMVSRLSESLGIQLILVSGESALSGAADRTFIVKKQDGVSTVTTTGME